MDINIIARTHAHQGAAQLNTLLGGWTLSVQQYNAGLRWAVRKNNQSLTQKLLPNSDVVNRAMALREASERGQSKMVDILVAHCSQRHRIQALLAATYAQQWNVIVHLTNHITPSVLCHPALRNLIVHERKDIPSNEVVNSVLSVCVLSSDQDHVLSYAVQFGTLGLVKQMLPQSAPSQIHAAMLGAASRNDARMMGVLVGWCEIHALRSQLMMWKLPPKKTTLMLDRISHQHALWENHVLQQRTSETKLRPTHQKMRKRM